LRARKDRVTLTSRHTDRETSRRRKAGKARHAHTQTDVQREIER